MKLVGAVTQGSGAINEDGWGYVGSADDVSAAWIFDGVTGINEHNFLGGGTDAIRRQHRVEHTQARVRAEAEGMRRLGL